MVRCILTNFHSPMFHLPQAAWMFLSQVCCFCPHLDKNLVLQTWRTLTCDMADRSLTSDTGPHGSVTPEVLTSVLSVMGSLASAFAEDERANLAEEITTRLVNVLESPNIIGAMVETMYKVLCLQCICHNVWFVWLSFTSLKGKFSSGIEGALASTLNRDFNWKQLSETILCIFLLMFSKSIWETLIQKQQKKKRIWISGVGVALYYDSEI